jgi:hypothetical protein
VGRGVVGFDGGEVLGVVAEVAAEVLDEPVEQRREVNSVPGSALVVVASRVYGSAVVANLAVGVACEGHEHGGPVGLAVRGRVDPAGGTGADLAAGQVGGVLAAAGGPVAAGAVFAAWVGFAADACGGEVAVELGEQLVQLAGVLAGGGGLVAEYLELGALFEQPGLPVIKAAPAAPHRRFPRFARPWEARSRGPAGPEARSTADRPGSPASGSCRVLPSSSAVIVQLAVGASRAPTASLARSAGADPGPAAHSQGISANENDGPEQDNLKPGLWRQPRVHVYIGR